ncbi:MAG: galactose mutarotase [Spirochaetaceae bacterium]|nr:galactose mutarotase [Spirochaetaceae bacterium]
MNIGMHINRKTFGTLSSGVKVYLYTLTLGDLSLTVSSFGAAWTGLCAPSRKTGKADLLLGFSTLEGYVHNIPFFGVTVGRFANRIGKARFSLEGKEYVLGKNNGENCLHGGPRGFDKRPWRSEAYEEKDGVFVRFELESPDGDEGFPGNLKAVVCYGLTRANEVIADYQANVDALCPVNLTNHAYFNLAGEPEGTILDHEVRLYASSYIPVDSAQIPLGGRAPVQDTPFDFRARKRIRRDIEAAGGGYDHCFAVEGPIGKLRPAAEVFEAGSGRTLRVFTTQPGIQFYTGNNIEALPGKAGSVYRKHSGFCLETQHFPDSPNQKDFPSAVFGPNREYHEKSLFGFDW